MQYRNVVLVSKSINSQIRMRCYPYDARRVIHDEIVTTAAADDIVNLRVVRVRRVKVRCVKRQKIRF